MQNHNVRYTKCSGPQSLKKRMENRIGLKSTHCKDGNQMFATFGPMESYPILEKGFHSRDVCKKNEYILAPKSYCFCFDLKFPLGCKKKKNFSMAK